MSNRFEYDLECIDSNENVYRCKDLNHLEAFGPSLSRVSSLGVKSYLTYDIPFLKGGFDRTGYSRQFEFFRNMINNKELDMKSIESCTDTYKIIERIISQ